jgi:DNA-binding NtrC family response regulator
MAKRRKKSKKSARRGSKADAVKDFAMNAVRRGQSLDDILGRVEKVVITSALTLTDYNRTDAAIQLGISRSSLYRRMEALGI